MARKPTKTIDVNGLSISDILQLNTSSFRGVSTANLKQVTSRLVSAMNKRIARMSKSEIGRMSPTYQAFERRGKYSVKGLTRESTLQVFRNLQESFHKASSLKEWKIQREKTFKELKSGGEFTRWNEEKQQWEKVQRYKPINIDFLKNDSEMERKFWQLFHHWEEEDKRIGNIKTFKYEFINFLAKKFERSGEPSERSIKWNITHLYNEMQKQSNFDNRNKSTTSFFEDVGNE